MAKFSLVPFVILSLLSITISSCKDDEEESIPTPEIQQQLKKLVCVKSYDESNNLLDSIAFTYDNNGRIISINSVYKFEYSGNSATMFKYYKPDPVYGSPADTIDYACQIGANGFFSNCIHKKEGTTLNMTWEYVGNHCSTYHDNSKYEHVEGNSFFNYTYDFVWENDDMVSSKMTYESSMFPTLESTIDFTYSNQNGEMLENKGLIGFNFNGINRFEFGAMRIEPGILHGYNSKHLPISYIETYDNGSSYQYTIDWVLNEEGYPEKSTSPSGSFDVFIWE